MWDEIVPQVEVGEGRQLAQYLPLHNLQLVAAQLQLPQLPTKVPPVVLYVVNLREIKILFYVYNSIYYLLYITIY